MKQNTYMELQQQLFEYFDTVLLDFDSLEEITEKVKVLLANVEINNSDNT